MLTIATLLFFVTAAASCVYLTRYAAQHLTFHRSSLCSTGRRPIGFRPMRHQADHLCLGFMCPSHDTNCVRRRR